jgi:hypothetical protein
MIYDLKQIVLPGSNLISLANYQKNFTQQLDAAIFAKLKPSVTAEDRNAIERCSPYPTARSSRTTPVQGGPDQDAQPAAPA